MTEVLRPRDTELAPLLRLRPLSVDGFHVRTIVTVAQGRLVRSVVLEVFPDVVLRRLARTVQTGPGLALGPVIPPFVDREEGIQTINKPYMLLSEPLGVSDITGLETQSLSLPV